MPRSAHRVAHKDCPNGVTSWDACDRVTREARGRCVAMTDKVEPCSKWVTDEFEGRGYCGQHYASAVNREMQRIRAAGRRAEIDARIDSYLEWTAEHPSVWDSMGGKAYTGAPAAARTPDALSAPPPRTKGSRVLWSALSGTPAPA